MDNGGFAEWWSSPAAHMARTDDDTANHQIRNLKRPRRTTSSWTGTKEHKNNAGAAAAAYSTPPAAPGPSASSASRKRAYEYSEHELDVSIQKLYKCNYWEDPAYEKWLRFFGLSLARGAAVDNLCDRVQRQYQANMAACAQYRLAAQASHGGDDDAPHIADYFTG